MIYNLIRSKRTIGIVICILQLTIISHQTCEITSNQKLLIDSPAQLLKEVPNGQKLLIGDLNDPEGNYLYVANLKGTSYQMGKAFGQLFSEQLNDQVSLFYNYYLTLLEGQIQNNKKIPEFLKKIMTKGTPTTLKKILQLNVEITRRYTNPTYYEEIRGIADGANNKAKRIDIEGFNIFPQLVKAACTVAGLWGKATQYEKTLHMRALDWDSANPINKYPLMTVYHPTQKGVKKHANFAWIGFIGVLTGMSEKITIGEKVWLPPKHSVKMTRFGNPWTYVLRDILSTADNMTGALDILLGAHRTCAIHLGIGSKDDHSFRMFEYSEKILNNYNDSNYTHYTTAHPKAAGVAYFDKHVQPSGDNCVGNVLIHGQNYGKWKAETFWRVLGMSHKTGNTQLVVFDLQAQKVFISYSRNYKDGLTDKTQDAYVRSPFYIEMNQYWKDF